MDWKEAIAIRTNALLETRHSGWDWLYPVGGAASLMVALLLLVAMISVIITGFRLDAINGWVHPFENNWLVVLAKLNAGFSSVHFDLLQRLNSLDLAIMALVAVMHLSLYATLRRTPKIGSVLAVLQPFLGMVLFIVTQTAGRSAVMGAGLVISCVMLRSTIFGKAIALLGILVNVPLLVGDFSTTPDSHSSIMAIIIGIGYVLLLVWLFQVARRLIHLPSCASTRNVAQVQAT